MAFACILLSIVCDTLDGLIARRLNAQSLLGAELDSLCDMANFGIIPIVILFMNGLHSQPIWAWIPMFVYICCAAMRLAQFNILSRGKNPPKGFIGLPSPFAALLVLSPITLGFESHILFSLWILLCGLLMISPIRIKKPFS